LFLNNRHYDPTVGVFVSVDPLVTPTMQPYIYGAANPIRYSDPRGLEPRPIHEGINQRDRSGGASMPPPTATMARKSSPRRPGPYSDGFHQLSYWTHLVVPINGRGSFQAWESIGGDGQAWAFLDGGRLEFGIDLPYEAIQLVGAGKVDDDAWVSVNGTPIKSRKFGHAGQSRDDVRGDYGFHASMDGYPDVRIGRVRDPITGKSNELIREFEAGDVVEVTYRVRNPDPYRKEQGGFWIFKHETWYHDTAWVTMRIQIVDRLPERSNN